MQRLRLTAKAAGADDPRLTHEAGPTPKPGPNEVLVAVQAAGVNPSDGRFALGAMPHAVWPRTPGRDWVVLLCEAPAG